MDKHAKIRLKLLNTIEKRIDIKAKQGQILLYSLVIEYLFANLKLDKNNKIKNSIENIRIINALDSIDEEIKKKFKKSFNKYLVKSAIRVLLINSNQFKNLKEYKPKTIQQQKTAILKELGVYKLKKGYKIKSKTYFDRILNAENAYAEIKNIAIRSSAIGITKQELLNKIKKHNTNNNLFYRHIKTNINDAYRVIDRKSQGNFAKVLKLNAALFVGSLIDDSRTFCIDRVNKVFTRKEIKEWSNLKWKGKSSPYNPIQDVGGYNCQHILSFLSNQRAIRLRPELKGIPLKEWV